MTLIEEKATLMSQVSPSTGSYPYNLPQIFSPSTGAVTGLMTPVTESTQVPFCLYPIIRRKYSFNIFKNRILLEFRQALTMSNAMALSGLWENTKINTYHSWPLVCKEKGNLTSRFGHHIVVLQDPIPTKS